MRWRDQILHENQYKHEHKWKPKWVSNRELNMGQKNQHKTNGGKAGT